MEVQVVGARFRNTGLALGHPQPEGEPPGEAIPQGRHDTADQPQQSLPLAGPAAGKCEHAKGRCRQQHQHDGAAGRAEVTAVDQEEQGTLVFPAPGGVAGRRRFSDLDAGGREAVLDAWQHSGWFLRRLVFTSLRALSTLGFFADPAVLRQLRLAPWAIDTPVCEADLIYPRIGAGVRSISWSEADLTALSDGTPLDLSGPWMAGSAEGPE